MKWLNDLSLGQIVGLGVVYAVLLMAQFAVVHAAGRYFAASMLPAAIEEEAIVGNDW